MSSNLPRTAEERKDRWADRPRLAAALKLASVLIPIAVSVAFASLLSRVVPRPKEFIFAAVWWIALTGASTVALILAERFMRRFLPLTALFRLSLVFPDQAPSRFKVAMKTNTLRQLQRTLAEGDVPSAGFQESAEQLVALASALNNHDRKTRGHTERVRAYTLMIGQELGLPQEDLDRLHWAGLVHDIGKITVPPEILNKDGAPTDEEWAILKQHPAAGQSLVEPLRPWLGEWADAASQHHERWDGRGYPLGLAGDQISLSGRIVAVADAYDVMTSIRSYKKALTPEVARAELSRNAGSQFDERVVRAFLNIAVGRLRMVMGPLSWLAQTPFLGNIPIGAAAGTAMSSVASLGVAVLSGVVGGDATVSPPAAALSEVPAPVATPVRLIATEDEPIVVALDGVDGGRPSRWAVVAIPDHMRLDASTPQPTLIPDADFHGSTSGRYEACWGEACSTATLRIDVTPTNDPPIATPDRFTTTEDLAIVFDPVTNDTDVDGDQLTLRTVEPQAVLTALAGQGSGTAAPTDVSVTPDGQVSFAPPADFVGLAQIAYTVGDDAGAVVTGRTTVEVTAVNDAPEAVDDRAVAVAGTPASINVLVNDTDIDGDELRVVATSAPEIAVPSADGQRVVFTPAAGSPSSVSFAYTAEDPSGARSTAEVTVSVLPGPSAAPSRLAAASQPEATRDLVAIAEDAPAHWITVLDNDRDADGALDTHRVRIVDEPGFGTAAVVGQVVVYQVDPNRNGNDELAYELCDSTGLCDTATVTIAISPVNDAPTFALAPSVTVSEDSGPATVRAITAITGGPSDETAQGVAFTSSIDRPGLFASPPTISPSGDVSFTPAPDANGVALLTVRAIDDAGTADGGVDTSADTTVAISITAVNDSVVATGDLAALDEDDSTGVTIDVLGNDSDIDGDALTIVSIDDSTISGGTVTDLGGGVLSYVPEANFFGVEDFSYTASDGHGSNATAHVTISVRALPDAPVAEDDGYATAENTALTVAAPGLLVNDLDPDGDPLTVNTVAISGPTNGTLALAANGGFTYTPSSGFVGTDVAFYEISDGTGRTTTSALSIVVDSGTSNSSLYFGTGSSSFFRNLVDAPLGTANPEPDIDDDEKPGFTLKEGNARESDLSLDENLYWSRSVTGSPLVVNGPVEVELWSTAKDFRTNLRATPVVRLFDCNSFGLFCTKIAEGSRNVDPYNGGVAGWVNVTVPLGNVNRTMAPGRRLVLRIQVEHEDIWIAASGSRPSQLRFTLANTAPVAIDDGPAAILEDAATTNLAVLGNDTDTNLNPATVTITSAPASGTAVALGDGTINYTPDPDANGADPFTYQVCDTGGLCDTATVTMTVTAVNDRPVFTAGADVTVTASDPPYSQAWATGISVGPANESGQSRTFTLTVSNPSLFSIQPTIAADGTMSFTLDGVATGFANINVELADNGGTANGGNDTAINRSFRIDVNP